MHLLAKMEGNIREIEQGEKRPHLDLELREFATVIREVILPHFEQEETGIYAQTARMSSTHQSFVEDMLREHRLLYAAFDQYLAALDPLDEVKIVSSFRTILNLLRNHIKNEEEVLPVLAEEINVL